MNLTTSYLGLRLKNPLVVGASPFCDNPAACLDLEAAGASAIVMHSLFEEQIDAEAIAINHHTDGVAESNPESTSFFPRYEDYRLGPVQYLHRLKHLKSLLSIPVIASLNGRQTGGWIDYAKQIEDTGADALELNIYEVCSDPEIPADQIEADILETVRAITAAVKLPVSVKLSPFHTSMANFAANLDGAGTAGLVLFNRFYQSDFDIDELEVVPQLRLSHSSELLLRLRWLSILSPNVKGSLACSGGVHTSEDVVKALLGGASAVQLVSVLLRQGTGHVSTLLSGLEAWMVEHGYETIDEFRGALNLRRCPNPADHERANYLRILQSWRV